MDTVRRSISGAPRRSRRLTSRRAIAAPRDHRLHGTVLWVFSATVVGVIVAFKRHCDERIERHRRGGRRYFRKALVETAAWPRRRDSGRVVLQLPHGPAIEYFNVEMDNSSSGARGLLHS